MLIVNKTGVYKAHGMYMRILFIIFKVHLKCSRIFKLEKEGSMRKNSWIPANFIGCYFSSLYFVCKQ